MLDHDDALRALRTHLLAMPNIATTGSATIGATKSAFARNAGSFITDGFVAGMEALPSGFSNNTPCGIKKVTDLGMDLRQEDRTIEAAASGRSLTVQLPYLKSWENRKAKPDANLWFLEEEYIAGPTTQVTLSEYDNFPTYVIKLYGFTNTGSQALNKVAKGVLTHFKPSTAIAINGGANHLRVRGRPSPFAGQILQDGEGYAFIVLTIPVRVRTLNP